MQADDWSDFQAFLAVARTGQLARAAKTMHVDATTIGRRIRRLEARIGQTLFEQTREGQVLTEAGDAVLARVEDMAAAAAGIAQGRQHDGGLSGTLRVGVPEGFGTWFLAQYLPAFAALHPQLTVELVANSSYLSLSKREADVAVFLSRPRAGPLIAQRLTGYALKLYAAPGYVDERGMPAGPADLAAGHVLVGYIPDLLYAPELRYLDEIHAGLAANIRSSSINAQHKLLAAGAGIGVLPCFIGDADPALVPVLDDKVIQRNFWLVTHKDTQQLAKVREFNAWLRRTVQLHRRRLMP